MLSDDELNEINNELQDTARPIFFFDDDPDGLSSFLILYKMVGDGRGVPIKSSPILDASFSSKVKDYSPDKVFILDKPLVSQEFIDDLKGTPVVWIDHHTPVKMHGVKYFNPRVHDAEKHKPTSYICYKAVKKPELLWIATLGCVADWCIPEYIDEFIEKYPDILDKRYEDPGKIIFETRLGELIKVFSFILKGKISDAIKCMKVLTRIQDPYEILDQTSTKGKFIYKRYLTIKKLYDEVLEQAVSNEPDDNILFFKYHDNKMSFTAEMSNELLHKFPDKVIIIAREKNGEMKCSLRSGKYKIEPMLKKALKDVEGYGGGHEYACGACIKVKDFDRFLENLRTEINTTQQ